MKKRISSSNVNNEHTTSDLPLQKAVSASARVPYCENSDIFYVREEGGSKTAGPVITGGVKIFSFAEDNSVRDESLFNRQPSYAHVVNLHPVVPRSFRITQIFEQTDYYFFCAETIISSLPSS